MTENQSVIEKIAMINCSGKKLKFFWNLPLTPGQPFPGRLAGRSSAANCGYSFFYS
ncbi:hypothetical protein [Burkholderia anthina]|uniref:hypothetical protein n=1 Tax=Burkholderia anthina TaxID=179879 RepID=UPI00158BB971|nr:hypothetical protein [Burkholderia anthina]